MKSPFFSICIPNYNYAQYVGETIESALRQSFLDFEIIVVDNASTDESWELICSYASRDARIKALRNDYNVGFAPNLQRASESASGEYIILLSSDDLMKPEALQVYYDIIKSDKAYDNNVVIHSAADHIDGNNKLRRLSYRFKAGEDPDYLGLFFSDEDKLDGALVKRDGLSVLKCALLNAYSPATFCTTCYPRSLWRKKGGYDISYQYQPDTAFLFKLLMLNPIVIYVNRSLFAYRIHEHNQNSKAINTGVIKQQFDKYIMYHSFSNTVLEELGIKRSHIEKVFVKEYCFKESLRALRLGYKMRAFKIMSFSFSTYPTKAITSLWLYAALGANLFSFILDFVPGFRLNRFRN